MPGGPMYIPGMAGRHVSDGGLLDLLYGIGDWSNNAQRQILQSVPDTARLADSLMSGETGPGEAGMAYLHGIESRWDPRNLANTFIHQPGNMALDLGAFYGGAHGIGGLQDIVDRVTDHIAQSQNPYATRSGRDVQAESRLTDAEEAAAQPDFVANLERAMARDREATGDYPHGYEGPDPGHSVPPSGRGLDPYRNFDPRDPDAYEPMPPDRPGRIKGTDPRLSPLVDRIGRGTRPMPSDEAFRTYAHETDVKNVPSIREHGIEARFDPAEEGRRLVSAVPEETIKGRTVPRGRARLRFRSGDEPQTRPNLNAVKFEQTVRPDQIIGVEYAPRNGPRITRGGYQTGGGY